MIRPARILVLTLFASCALLAQSNDPFPQPIGSTTTPVQVGIADFARLPGRARPMMLVTEPGTRRLFVNDLAGPLYLVSYDGRSVGRYLDISAPEWGVRVNSAGTELGFQSFAFHPQFNQRGTPGYGKLYTFTDSSNTTPRPDFLPSGSERSHHTVLLEWTAKNPAAATYDGGAPRELLRISDPFGNHNGGQLAFNPLAMPGSPDFGLLYVAEADGGSGGDPLKMAENPASIFGKLLRIDPLGTNSANKHYGIPRDNPFAGDNNPQTLDEIFALGLRNPQRFGWDPSNGHLFVADIGQGTVEEVSLIARGNDAGWSTWEGSYKYSDRRSVDTASRRSDPRVTYPVVEYDHRDPLLGGQVAVTGVVVYRGNAIPQLTGLLLFGDNPSGEVFAVNADRLPAGGQDSIRRVLFTGGSAPRTLLQIIREKTTASRVDLRFGSGPEGQVYLLNKQDGVIRQLVR